MGIIQSLELFAAKINTSDVGNLPTADSNTVLNNGLNIIYFLAGAIAVIVIVIAGMMYATSSGDPSKVAKAKNMLLYSIIGLVLVLAAFAITWFVIGRIQ